VAEDCALTAYYSDEKWQFRTDVSAQPIGAIFRSWRWHR